MPQGLRLPKGTEEKQKALKQASKDVMPDWLEKAMNLIGMGPDTPLEDQLVGGLTPNPMGAVSVFMKKGGGGIPARVQATKEATTKLLKVMRAAGFGPEDLSQAETVVKKFPRVMSHITNSALDEGTGGLAATLPWPEGRSEIFIDPNINRLYRDVTTGALPIDDKLLKEGLTAQDFSPARSVVHEMTHVAQNIGKKGQAFKEKSAPGFDYATSPRERSARETARRKVPKPAMPIMPTASGESAEDISAIMSALGMLGFWK